MVATFGGAFSFFFFFLGGDRPLQGTTTTITHREGGPLRCVRRSHAPILLLVPLIRRGRQRRRRKRRRSALVLGRNGNVLRQVGRIRLPPTSHWGLLPGVRGLQKGFQRRKRRPMRERGRRLHNRRGKWAKEARRTRRGHSPAPLKGRKWGGDRRPTRGIHRRTLARRTAYPLHRWPYGNTEAGRRWLRGKGMASGGHCRRGQGGGRRWGGGMCEGVAPDGSPRRWRRRRRGGHPFCTRRGNGGSFVASWGFLSPPSPAWGRPCEMERGGARSGASGLLWQERPFHGRH